MVTNGKETRTTYMTTHNPIAFSHSSSIYWQMSEKNVLFRIFICDSVFHCFPTPLHSLLCVESSLIDSHCAALYAQIAFPNAFYSFELVFFQQPAVVIVHGFCRVHSTKQPVKSVNKHTGIFYWHHREKVCACQIKISIEP